MAAKRDNKPIENAKITEEALIPRAFLILMNYKQS